MLHKLTRTVTATGINVTDFLRRARRTIIGLTFFFGHYIRCSCNDSRSNFTIHRVTRTSQMGKIETVVYIYIKLSRLASRLNFHDFEQYSGEFFFFAHNLSRAFTGRTIFLFILFTSNFDLRSPFLRISTQKQKSNKKVSLIDFYLNVARKARHRHIFYFFAIIRSLHRWQTHNSPSLSALLENELSELPDDLTFPMLFFGEKLLQLLPPIFSIRHLLDVCCVYIS